VYGKTTVLDVLGSDDAGEANLTYTWALTTGPAGAHPVFSSNGTNAAKHVTVTFDKAGNYSFTVTITDAGGLSATSGVSVAVVQAVTQITVSPGTVTLALGGRQQFTATATDQFGAVLAQQPAFTWAVVSGSGTVSSTGLYTAPNQYGRHATVQASAAGVGGQAIVLTQQYRFLQALYQAELGRTATVAEMDGWVDVLNGPIGQQGVVSAIGHSAEARDRLVKGWYTTYLGRPAGSGEELPFVNLLVAGLTEEQVLGIILGGGEFFNHAQGLVSSGTPQQRVVVALYQLLLGRTPGPAELSAQVNNLALIGQPSLAQMFLQSWEYRSRVVAGYYLSLLHRPADQAGLTGWVASGLDLGTIRHDLEASPEFFANA
jgi:hypothetical protein